jgi:hypothetical protein
MNNCPNCAPYECYNICPNSPNYYTPEQERADDAFYGADRYDGFGDPEVDFYDHDDDNNEILPAYVSRFTWDSEQAIQQRAIDFPDDIPF